MPLRIAPASVAVAAVFLAGCAASGLLSPDERNQVCEVRVETRFEAATFQPNPLAGQGGGAFGALAGAGVGIYAGFPGAIVTVPLGAIMGAIAGTACASAASAHPDAEARFAEELASADVGFLARSLEAAMNAPRAGCPVPARFGAAPAAVIEIEKLEAGLACMLDKPTFWVAVRWRTVIGRDGRSLNWTSTRCTQTSVHDADAWAAEPGLGQAELEHALEATGRRMAGLLLDKRMPYECKLRSDEPVDVVAK